MVTTHVGATQRPGELLALITRHLDREDPGRGELSGRAGDEDALVLPGAKTTPLPSCADTPAEIQPPLRREACNDHRMP
jgi:hypothetical protein